jgi:hypothetical protein
MNSIVEAEIKKVALGYGLEYKITNRRMKHYLAPAFNCLRNMYPGLRYEEFIAELLRVRQEERLKCSPTSYDFENYGIEAWLNEAVSE